MSHNMLYLILGVNLIFTRIFPPSNVANLPNFGPELSSANLIYTKCVAIVTKVHLS